MKKHLYLFFVCCLLVATSLFSAVFTIENYTGSPIEVEIRLKMRSKSSSIQAKIAAGRSYRFNTGFYSVDKIEWTKQGRVFYLDRENFTINPLMLGGVIRLFKTDTYEFKFPRGDAGYGRVNRVYGL